jgi:hypothetical protein
LYSLVSIVFPCSKSFTGLHFRSVCKYMLDPGLLPRILRTDSNVSSLSLLSARLLVMILMNEADDIVANAYFMSYLPMGIDFLIHPTTHKVLKVVLHGNIPGEVLFGRYGRARWTVTTAVSESGVSESDKVRSVPSHAAPYVDSLC